MTRTRSNSSLTKSVRWSKSAIPKSRLTKRKPILRESADVRTREASKVSGRLTLRKRCSPRSWTKVSTRRLVTRTTRRSLRRRTSTKKKPRVTILFQSLRSCLWMSQALTLMKRPPSW